MPTATQPEIKVLAYPAAAISQRGLHSCILADVLGGNMNLGGGDSGGLAIDATTNPTVSIDWQQPPNAAFTSITNLEFVRFNRDGTFREGASPASLDGGGGQDISGFMLKGRYGYLDCKVGTTTLDTAYTDLHFQALAGTWKTVRPPDAPHRDWILNTGNDIDARVETVGDIAARRSLRIDLAFLAHQPGGPQPRCRVLWGGGQYSVLLVHGQKMTVEKLVNDVWVVLRTMTQLPVCKLSGLHYVVDIRIIAGRLCISTGGSGFHIVEMSTPTVPGERAKPVNTNWAAGKLEFHAYNVRVRVGVALIKYATAADTPFTGNFARHLPRREPVHNPGNVPIVAQVAGWASNGTTATAQVTVTPPAAGPPIVTGAIDYTCTLTANAAGIDTPFVRVVTAKFDPLWNVTNLSPIDIGPAVRSATVSLASPPNVPMGQATLDIERAVLNVLQPSWQSYAARHHPIEILARWHYDDGTAGYYNAAGAFVACVAADGSDWFRLFKGYIHEDPRALSGYARYDLRLTCRDPLTRLKGENARVDHHYPPLALIFMGMAAGVTNATLLRLNGSDAIAEILNIAAGPDEVSNMNGNGNRERYFPSSHVPLLSTGSDTGGYIVGYPTLTTGQPPTEADLMLAPPFGEDVVGWFEKIAKIDFALPPFYGWPAGYTGAWPALIYGRVREIVRSRPLHVIPDNAYAAGDQNKLLSNVDIDIRPERDINVVDVWSNPPDSGTQSYLPAIRMAEARVDPSDINAPELSWERKLIVREPLGYAAGIAESIANGIIAEITNRKPQWPKIRLRGYPSLQWGDLLQVNMSGALSDSTLGLQGQTFRVEPVTHNLTFDPDSGSDWTTEAGVRPLSTSEQADFNARV